MSLFAPINDRLFINSSGEVIRAAYSSDGNLVAEYGSVLSASKANGIHHSKIKIIIGTMGGYFKGNYFTY